MQAIGSGATRPGEPGGDGALGEWPDPKWREVRLQKERIELTCRLLQPLVLLKIATSCPNTTSPPFDMQTEGVGVIFMIQRDICRFRSQA